MKIDLDKYIFPQSDTGVYGPLPKQKQFMDMADDPKGPKCLSYFGGVGSGKSVVICGTILRQAIRFGGEYVVARQFMPELRRTTMKAFLEMIPPDLLIEHRVVDAEVKIKSLSGKPATVYFVGLDEPAKLLSLNLSGAGIDEASEVSEEAFLLLLNRLRNKNGLRKMYLVGNPRGHNWVYKYFIAKTGLKNPESYHLILAPSTENIHLPDGYVQGMLDTYSIERIKRDIYGSFDSFEGQVYSEFDRSVHVVRPFRIPDNWERHIRIDHGYRNPAAILLAAISPDGDVYVYREIYHREWLIRELVIGNPKEGKKGLADFIGKETKAFKTAKIDPSTKARRGTTGESDYDEYRRHWPSKLPVLQMAKNDVQLGIDRVKAYLKPHPKLKRPALYIFESCTNLLDEISTYRYPELRPSEQGNKSDKEAPLKVNDHAVDALRYLIVDLPEPYKPEVTKEAREKKYTNVEIAFQDLIQDLKKPSSDSKDPFGDGI
jgi:PBSX family phage terminase large subunit